MTAKKSFIRYFLTDGFKVSNTEGVKHVKILPYLSIVQAVEGSYEIAIGNHPLESTGEGGFFIAPSDMQQTIIHHDNPKNNQMRARWLFVDVEVNNAYALDTLYHFPTVLPKTAQEEMNELFNVLFSAKDIWAQYSVIYSILHLLLAHSTPKQRHIPPTMQTILDYIITNYTRPICIQDLAQLVHMSESNLHITFKKHFGLSPIAYLNHFRLSLAAEQLRQTQRPIGQIADSVGIQDPLYFCKLFKKNFGFSPKAYRLQHQNSD
ncbi:MAG: helix-turn-helix transcriptional regulator [Clostridia bacterium]|nr:helix-turn-helix transcriptional regulator [Clostridia bacterium]